VYDGDANVSIFEYNYNDAYLLSCDYVEGSNAAVFMTRWENPAPVTSFSSEALGFFVLRHDGTSFVVNPVFIDEPTITFQTSSGVPKAIRQGHCAATSATGLNYIINMLPTDSKPGTGDAAWGETLVGRLSVPALPGFPLPNLPTQVSDGATAGYDGSAMVSIGGTEADGIVAATCSMIDGGVRTWTWNNTTLSSGPSLFVYDGIKGYGPLWIAPNPGAVATDRRTWFPGLDVSSDYLETFWRPWIQNAPGYPGIGASLLTDYDYCPASTYSYGHNFMYGYVQKDALGRTLLSFHGMLNVTQKRLCRMTWRSGGNTQSSNPNLVAKDNMQTLGTVFSVITSNNLAVVDTIEAHNCQLLAPGHLDPNTDNDWEFHGVVASKWYFNINGGLATTTSGDGLVYPARFGDGPTTMAGYRTLREQWLVRSSTLLYNVGNAIPNIRERVLNGVTPIQQYHSGVSLKLRIPSTDDLDIETTSLYGQDDILPHTSPVHRWNMFEHYAFFQDGDAFAPYEDPTGRWLLHDDIGAGDLPAGSEPEPRPILWRIFDIHTCGGYWDEDRGQFIVGGTRWKQIDIDNLWDGPRSLKRPNTLSGDGQPYFDWEDAGRRFGPQREFTPCYFRLFEPSTIAVNTPQNVIVTAGNAMVFDGTNLFPLLWYVPPQPIMTGQCMYLGINNGDVGENPLANMSAQACWFYKDDVGTTWRSATSFKLDQPMGNFRREAFSQDAVWTAFDRPIPIPAPIRGKIGIEYYMTQPTDSSVEPDLLTGDGPMALWAWSDALGAQAQPLYPPDVLDVGGELNLAYPYIGLSIGWSINLRQFNTLLIYTTGGILDDEPPIAPTYLAFTNNRVWYTRDGRLYFSKVVSKDKPVGFNGVLYIDAPTGEDLVACAAMDENVVAFGRNTVFLVTGIGPNDLGFTGKSNFTISTLATAVGCYNPNSVVSTDAGIFYAGYDTLYLIRRDNNVVRIGKVESSFSVQNCRYAFYDRERQRILWYISGKSDDGYFVVYELERNLWFTWYGGDDSDERGLTSSIWTPNGIHHIADSGLILRQDATFDRPPANLKTGWINLANAMHFKRFRDGYCVTRQGTPSQIDVEYCYDYVEAPTETHSYTTVAGDADLGRFKPARQKCAALSLNITVDNPQGAVLTHLAFEVGKKQLGDKIPRR
jgi:hypothetical protein